MMMMMMMMMMMIAKVAKTTTGTDKPTVRQNQYLLVLGFNKNLKNPFVDSIFITLVPRFFLFLQHKKRISVIYFFTSKQGDFAKRLDIFLMKVTH